MPVAMISSRPCPELGPGWNVQLYPRKGAEGGSKTTYKIFQAPDGTRYKSLVQAQAALTGPSCIACGSGEDTPGNEILLCDTNGCKQAWHMKCLEDPLDFVPPGDWFCPDCEDRMDLALQTRVEPHRLDAAALWARCELAAARHGCCDLEGGQWRVPDLCLMELKCKMLAKVHQDLHQVGTSPGKMYALRKQEFLHPRTF